MKLKNFITFLFLFSIAAVWAQPTPSLEGRWDITIVQNGKESPSWLEVRHSGYATMVGRFVGSSGSARPISKVNMEGNNFSFSIPPQWEGGKENLQWEGTWEGDAMKGTVIYPDGKAATWTGVRAPLLARVSKPVWAKPIMLFNGKDLHGWHADGNNNWVAESGVLKNLKQGSNLFSDDVFTDFKLHIECRYPKGSNSGIYLRGRYEVQIMDGKGLFPLDVDLSGLYGFLEPNEVATKGPNEWQTFDITLVGRSVTIVLNGKTVINDQIIPGITGGAMNSREGEPGPFMLQGDHGPVEFRNIVVTPGK